MSQLILSAPRVRSHIIIMGIGCLLFCTTGATCMPRRTISEFSPKPVFDKTPTLEEAMQSVNKTQAIQQLQSNNVSVTIPGVPAALSANLKLERPRRFRMTAGMTRFTGTDFDLGSNDDVFWMQTRHASPPSIFCARHDQFESLLNRQILPVSPLWVTEALGLVEMDPRMEHQAPMVRADGDLEIRSLIPTAAVAYHRVKVLDAKYAFLKQLILYDSNGRMLANAQQSEHQYYPAVQYSLPHHVRVQLVPTDGQPLSFDLDIGFYIVNQLVGDDANRWAFPDPTGFKVVDLVALDQGSPTAVTPPGYQAVPRTTQMPQNIRGFR